MARPSQRNQQVIRQWEILRALEERPSTIQQLAFDFEVTPRTVRRDLDALQAARFPLVDERGDDREIRWRLIADGVVPPRRAA